MTMRVAHDISLVEREAHELAAFSRVAREGRSRTADEDLILPRRHVRRLLETREGTPEPREQMILWTRPLQGSRILEICCHDGELGAILAMGGAEVTGVDLCPDLIAQARRRIRLNQLQGRMTAQVMSVHSLDFPDDHFDFVFGKASLQHLDLEAAKREIFRVLKPGGYGVFSEPVSFSRLDAHDLARFCVGFVDVERAYFRLVRRLDRVLPPLCRPLRRLDRALLDGFPALRSLAGSCVFRVRKPAPGARGSFGMEPWGQV